MVSFVFSHTHLRRLVVAAVALPKLFDIYLLMKSMPLMAVRITVLLLLSYGGVVAELIKQPNITAGTPIVKLHCTRGFCGKLQTCCPKFYCRYLGTQRPRCFSTI
ncbi:uncharacterized protein LOC131948159 [Physella acuta]|uniref:uncharacterized protein LOC131948159 n=1 Tax=Physella acuta TaxID=109671 RepID=UPI0027DD5437|nr:uncharacterized protein LOC131948159 [Physella acuta]